MKNFNSDKELILAAEMYKLAESYTANLAIFAEKTKHMDVLPSRYQEALHTLEITFETFMQKLDSEYKTKDDNEQQEPPRIEI